MPEPNEAGVGAIGCLASKGKLCSFVVSDYSSVYEDRLVDTARHCKVE